MQNNFKVARESIRERFADYSIDQLYFELADAHHLYGANNFDDYKMILGELIADKLARQLWTADDVKTRFDGILFADGVALQIAQLVNEHGRDSLLVSSLFRALDWRLSDNPDKLTYVYSDYPNEGNFGFMDCRPLNDDDNADGTWYFHGEFYYRLLVGAIILHNGKYSTHT